MLACSRTPATCSLQHLCSPSSNLFGEQEARDCLAWRLCVCVVIGKRKQPVDCKLIYHVQSNLASVGAHDGQAGPGRLPTCRTLAEWQALILSAPNSNRQLAGWSARCQMGRRRFSYRALSDLSGRRGRRRRRYVAVVVANCNERQAGRPQWPIADR